MQTDDIIQHYSSYINDNAHPPKTIAAFCEVLKIEEKEFYSFFSSFEAIDRHILHQFGQNTIQLIQQSEDYSQYDAQTKLLSFYYTFFEILTANRSLAIVILNQKKSVFFNYKKLTDLNDLFQKYIQSLEISTFKIPIQQIENIKGKSIGELAWLQLLSTIQFWIKDTSIDFEKTDIYIEKSINASFKLIDTSRTQSIFDFFKFIWNEKTK